VKNDKNKDKTQGKTTFSHHKKPPLPGAEYRMTSALLPFFHKKAVAAEANALPHKKQIGL